MQFRDVEHTYIYVNDVRVLWDTRMSIHIHNVDAQAQWNVIVSTINGHNLDTG